MQHIAVSMEEEDLTCKITDELRTLLFIPSRVKRVKASLSLLSIPWDTWHEQLNLQVSKEN